MFILSTTSVYNNIKLFSSRIGSAHAVDTCVNDGFLDFVLAYKVLSFREGVPGYDAILDPMKKYIAGYMKENGTVVESGYELRIGRRKIFHNRNGIMELKSQYGITNLGIIDHQEPVPDYVKPEPKSTRRINRKTMLGLTGMEKDDHENTIVDLRNIFLSRKADHSGSSSPLLAPLNLAYYIFQPFIYEIPNFAEAVRLREEVTYFRNIMGLVNTDPAVATILGDFNTYSRFSYIGCRVEGCFRTDQHIDNYPPFSHCDFNRIVTPNRVYAQYRSRFISTPEEYHSAFPDIEDKTIFIAAVNVREMFRLICSPGFHSMSDENKLTTVSSRIDELARYIPIGKAPMNFATLVDSVEKALDDNADDYTKLFYQIHGLYPGFSSKMYYRLVEELFDYALNRTKENKDEK